MDEQKNSAGESKTDQKDVSLYTEENAKDNNFGDPTGSSRMPENKKRSNRKPFFVKISGYLLSGIAGSVVTVFLLSYSGFSLDDGDGIEEGTLSGQTDDAVYTSTFSSEDEASAADVVEEVSPAVVGVVNLKNVQSHFSLNEENVQSGTGSGVIFKKDNRYGYIITNYHVIEGANEIEISLYDGEKVKAELVGGDALTDLAVLRIDEKHVDKVARFGDSNKLRAGDEVIAIGNPLGLEFSRTVTRGIVSATDRTISVNTSAGEWDLSVIQTDAAINPGNSGGALINASGEVIGINSLKISREGIEGLGFAIPSNDVLPIAEELIKNGEIKRPYLGIQMYDIEKLVPFYRQSIYGNIKSGIIVVKVEPGSPAMKAGLKENDVITAVDGNEVKNVAEFRKYLYSNIKPGEQITVECYREGKKESVTITTDANK